MSTYRVTVRVQYPAWDERDGFIFHVDATSKRDAIKAARHLNAQGGQVHSQQGLSWWTATPSEDSED